VHGFRHTNLSSSELPWSCSREFRRRQRRTDCMTRATWLGDEPAMRAYLLAPVERPCRVKHACQLAQGSELGQRPRSHLVQ
jgi:hypothetical protein